MQNLVSLTKDKTKVCLYGLVAAAVVIFVMAMVFVNGGADATNKKEIAVSALKESSEIQGIAELLKQDGSQMVLSSKVSLSDLGQKDLVQLPQDKEEPASESLKPETNVETRLEKPTTEKTTTEKPTTEKTTAESNKTEITTTETLTKPEQVTTTEPVTEPVTEVMTEVSTQSAVRPAKPEYAYHLVEFNITDSDYYWLIRIVEAEAGNQDAIGKILVANVIFNRVRSHKFANTVEAVIFQNSGRTYQFSPVKNGRIYSVTPSQHTIDCVGKAMAGEDYSNGALYFTMRTSSNSWFNRELNFLFKHGDHYFYSH